MTTKVNDYDNYAQAWQHETTVHRALSGGWREVQRICLAGQLDSAATALLPPMAVELRKDSNGDLYQESKDLYRRRVKLTILTNFYARTALYMTGLVFGGGKVSWDGVPDGLKYLVSDADGEGRGASDFFAWQFYSALVSGVRCCYVNSAKPENAGVSLEAEDKAKGYRVKFSDVPGMNILGGRNDQVRLLASGQESDGEFGWKETDNVYVLSSSEIDLWRKSSENGDFSRIDGYPIRHKAGMMPATFFVPGDYIGPYHGVPVLDDLAALGLQHLRVSSLDAQYCESSNWMYVHGNGFDLAGGIQSPLTVWTAGQWVDDGMGNDRKWSQYDGEHPPYINIAEPSGQVSVYNKERLEEIKNNASLWGMAQLRPDGISFSTATGWNITQKSTTSSLSMWADAMENYIQQNFVIAGKMHGIDVEDEEKVCVLEKDFSNIQLEQLTMYAGLVDQQVISKKTLFDTIKRAGGVETTNNWEQEQDDITDEQLVANQTAPIIGSSGDLAK